MTPRDISRRARGLVRVDFWLPVELVAALDEVVGRRGRARWLRACIEAAVKAGAR